MRLIDADELCKNFGRTEGCQISCVECESFNCTIGRVVKAAPTVEAEPVKHGRWIRAEAKGYPVKRPSIWYCSECSEKIKYNDTLGRYQKIKKTVSQVNPRCRKCGAKMDGGAD